MRETILDFPKQFKEGIEKAKDVRVEGRFENIIICGMGGSALPADLLLIFFNDLKLPLYIHRSYNLPPQATKESLIICISFSGNTKETISTFKEAQERKLKAAAITAGGELAKSAKKYNTPLVFLPSVKIQPRWAFGYLFGALIKVLSNSGVIEDNSDEILKIAEKLKPLELETQGKSLAKKLVGKIPLVYASNKFKSLARIWKINFNENSKIMAFWNYFPELIHDEIVGYSNLKNFHVIILRDSDDHPKILKAMDLTADLLKQKGIEVDFVELEKKNVLEKVFNNLILSDWVSYYLAKEYKIDPTPVEIVEEFKKKLKE
ncbi:MAG: bifunctional phosphoglucose/phosphomannose isomerase [Candidatus Nealsonbacteria bacterium]